MAYEVILPIPVSLEALVDQMAHAAWNALTTGRVAVELYPGYYIPMRQAIEDELQRSLLEEEDLGAAHGYRFAGGGGPGCRLEDAIVMAMAARLPGILGDVRVADIFQQAVPLAVRSVLEPFLWFEGEDDRSEENSGIPVPGPRAGDRNSGVVSSPSGKH
jgi:hypothetical protein